VDSPVQLKKIYSDMNKKEYYDLYYNIDDVLGELMLYAAYMHRWKSVKVFIEAFNTDKNYQAVDGRATVLIIASWRGNHTFVKWLLALSDKDHESPLNLSVKGQLMHTSACGGKGPFTAHEWVLRKSEVCGKDNAGFRLCSSLLKKKEEEKSDKN